MCEHTPHGAVVRVREVDMRLWRTRLVSRGPRLRSYIVTTDAGDRTWQATDARHAREQSADAFPDETILSVRLAEEGTA